MARARQNAEEINPSRATMTMMMKKVRKGFKPDKGILAMVFYAFWSLLMLIVVSRKKPSDIYVYSFAAYIISMAILYK